MNYFFKTINHRERGVGELRGGLYFSQLNSSLHILIDIRDIMLKGDCTVRIKVLVNDEPNDTIEPSPTQGLTVFWR